MLSPAIPIDEKISHFESKLLNNVITTPLLARPRKQTPCLNPTKVQPIVVNLRIHILPSLKIVIKMSRIDCHKAPRLILHTPLPTFSFKTDIDAIKGHDTDDYLLPSTQTAENFDFEFSLLSAASSEYSLQEASMNASTSGSEQFLLVAKSVADDNADDKQMEPLRLDNNQ